MSWAEVKKINSNLNKPLNELIEKSDNKILYRTSSSISCTKSTDEFQTLLSANFIDAVKLSGLTLNMDYTAPSDLYQYADKGGEMLFKLTINDEAVIPDGDMYLNHKNTGTHDSPTYTIVDVDSRKALDNSGEGAIGCLTKTYVSSASYNSGSIIETSPTNLVSLPTVGQLTFTGGAMYRYSICKNLMINNIKIEIKPITIYEHSTLKIKSNFIYFQ